jgi:hypothetical protein
MGKAPGISWIGSWRGPRAGLDPVGKRKKIVLVGNRTLIVQSVGNFLPSVKEKRVL